MMKETTRVYIKVDRVDFGFSQQQQQQQSNKTTYMACIGSRNTFKEHGSKFTSEERSPNYVWSYVVDNVSRSSFVLGLYKCHFLSSHKEIGHIELKLKGMEPNTITTQEITLPTTSNTSGFSPKITLSIHITNNGSEPFRPNYSNNNLTNSLL